MNKKYAICYNSEIQNADIVLNKLQNLLKNYSITADKFEISKLKKGYELVFVIGGDGTILKAARYYSNYSCAVFGINLGRLGFLSQAGEKDLSLAVQKVIEGDYNLEERIMLSCGKHNALNDFVIKGTETSRMSKFSLTVNGKFVCEYQADGIIISTPTGSTAYGMSAGGPVLAPDVNSIAITPICPHTFDARPLVINADSEISITPSKNQKYLISADGQENFESKKEITIIKSKVCAKLALLKTNDFYSVLRDKLHWGFSPASINK